MTAWWKLQRWALRVSGSNRLGNVFRIVAGILFDLFICLHTSYRLKKLAFSIKLAGWSLPGLPMSYLIPFPPVSFPVF